MNTEQARQDQINEGRNRTLRQSSDGRKVQPKKPFVAKGHDIYLKQMQDTGSQVTITRMGDGSTETGKFTARDKYTITITTDDGRRMTFFKHAIESFEPAVQ